MYPLSQGAKGPIFGAHASDLRLNGSSGWGLGALALGFSAMVIHPLDLDPPKWPIVVANHKLLLH